MRIFRYQESGQPIDRFSSRGASLTKILQIQAEASVHWLFLKPGGLIGYHPAVENQLFLIVEGGGWVRAGQEPAQPVSTGQAVFWEAGEWHESGTESGMAVLALEGRGLQPFLPKG